MDMFGMNGYMSDQFGMDIGMMQDPMYMNPMQNQMYMNQMGNIPRITHKAALDMLRYYVAQQYNCYIQKEKKIEEIPQELRHSCLQTGVTKLPLQYYNIIEAGIQIPYYFCNYCGTLYIFKDFM